MTDWVVAKRGGEAKDRVGRNDRLSPGGERKQVKRQGKGGKKRQGAVKRISQGGRKWKTETGFFFFLLYAAWVRSRAERPSVSYTKVVMEVAWTGHNLQCKKTN